MQVFKKLLLTIVLVSSIQVHASYAPRIVASKPQNAPESTKRPQNDISVLVQKYSQIYSISPVIMTRIIACESSNNPNARNLTEVESSYGLVQINLKAHTNITIEQATDPEFAVEFLAKNFDNAPRMWFNCYRKATQE